jgi:hypothetical protein
LSLSISPDGTLLAPAATQQFSASIQGATNTSVTWSVDGTAEGNSTVGTITAAGLYTAPNATGAHTITASSVAYPSVSASSSLLIQNTAPGAVLTYHNDDARDGAFTQETMLMPSVVNSSQFGKLQSYPVDGQIYAQPLYVPQLGISGVTHNVVFVATENNTVDALDADGLQSSPLWSKNLGTPSPRNDAEGISPMLGITSTPVIDITTGTLYAATITTSGFFFTPRYHLELKVWRTRQITGWSPAPGDNNNGTIQIEAGCFNVLASPRSRATKSTSIWPLQSWLALAYDKTTLQKAILTTLMAPVAVSGMEEARLSSMTRLGKCSS